MSTHERPLLGWPKESTEAQIIDVLSPLAVNAQVNVFHRMDRNIQLGVSAMLFCPTSDNDEEPGIELRALGTSEECLLRFQMFVDRCNPLNKD